MTSRTVDMGALPERFPTHRHDPSFWEALGRAVATFGFLEDVLGRAIYALTATRPYKASEIEEAYRKWRLELEKALTDPLGGLIDRYGKAVREHPEARRIPDLDELLARLRKAAEIRNALCHASWDRIPDESGASVPRSFRRRGGDVQIFDSSVDRAWLDRTQRGTAELCCAVVNSVIGIGLQFPGNPFGPGKPIRS